MSKFPETIAAAKGSDGSQWKIGEALLHEAEESYTGPRGLQAVADELEKNGLEFSTSYLSNLRTTAEAFPRNRRHELPWKVHSAAGNPDSLDVIVKAARKDGEKVTIWYVEDVLRRIREDERRKREEAKAEAAREQAEAEAEEAEAKARAKKAKDETERSKARRQQESARERKRKAREKKDAIKLAPKRKEIPPPAEDDVAVLVAQSFALANAGKARRLAEESRKKLGRNVSDLSVTAINALAEAALKAANAWTDVANHVRSTSANKRGHLAVVNE